MRRVAGETWILRERRGFGEAVSWLCFVGQVFMSLLESVLESESISRWLKFARSWFRVALVSGLAVSCSVALGVVGSDVLFGTM